MGHHRKVNPLLAVAGFTLIEILVVTFIVATMLGMVALHLTRSDSDVLRDEAERLTVLLYGAREEAVLRGQLVAFELRPTGYRFLHIGEKGAFTAFKDGPLVGHDFSEPIRARIEIEGQQPTGRHAMIFDPSSALPSFNVNLTLKDTQWWVLGQNNGTICSTPQADRCPSSPASANANR